MPNHQRLEIKFVTAQTIEEGFCLVGKTCLLSHSRRLPLTKEANMFLTRTGGSQWSSGS
jgi:hypothetical protein